MLPSLFFFFNDTATTEIYTLSLHDALPICGSLLHALALPALPFVRLDEPSVELAVLEQQHHEHKARRQQPIDPAGIETEVETAGVKDRGERDIEEPRAHHDHEPQVEHRVRPAPPENG